MNKEDKDAHDAIVAADSSAFCKKCHGIKVYYIHGLMQCFACGHTWVPNNKEE